MAVKKTRSSYPSSAGQGIDVSYAVWKDDTKKPIGVIQLTHGWGEYGERYDGLATFLAENGYVVVAQDHLGHGRTTGYKALGVYPRKAAKYMVEDMHLLYEILHKQYKKLPYMLYGHSMGSMMTRLYLPKWGDELTAAVVCGTIYSIWPEAFLVPVINTVTPLLAKSY
ncbi:MAG: alpha/beta fold hydrolase, partial [Clostridia bacterium]|nr:alpha/beta fold hydrolase [Clostridia bacterium]